MNDRVGSQTEDLDLLWRVRQRDPEALARLYDRYGCAAYGLALRILRDPEAAAEVVQEVFLRLWQRPDHYDPLRGTVATWLLSLTHHRAIDLVRARRRQGQAVLALAQSDGPAEAETALADLAWLHERRQAVRQALAELAPVQRQVIELAYFDGLTQREIAALLGEPLGTVKTRLRLGMQRLRSLLAARGMVETDD